jgi:predicted thioredoxin/glutaredoxin
MVKIPAIPRDGSLHAEKDVRLRIELLEGQSSSIAKMLAKAIQNHNEGAFKEYSSRLAENLGRIEELLWVLEEKADQSVLELQVAGGLSVKEAIEKLRMGELKMDDLPADAQAMVRKGAVELKNARK